MWIYCESPKIGKQGLCKQLYILLLLINIKDVIRWYMVIKFQFQFPNPVPIYFNNNNETLYIYIFVNIKYFKIAASIC